MCRPYEIEAGLVCVIVIANGHTTRTNGKVENSKRAIDNERTIEQATSPSPKKDFYFQNFLITGRITNR